MCLKLNRIFTFNATRFLHIVLVSKAQLSPIIGTKHEDPTGLSDQSCMLVATGHLNNRIVLDMELLRLEATFSTDKGRPVIFKNK